MVTTATRTADGGLDIKVAGKSAATVPAEQVLPGLRKKWDAFEGSLRKSRDRALDLGKALVEKKADLDHGQFGRLFSDHDDKADNALPFTRSWSARLMRLADNSVISNVDQSLHLPADLNTVYELAMMSAPALEQAIEEGKVTPQTTRDEAKALRKEAAGEPPSEPRTKPPKSERDTLDDCAHTIEEAIADALLAHPTLSAAIAARLQLILQGFK